MNNIFIELLPPWVETGLQPAFYDKESGTVLQQTARMYAKVNELVASYNEFEQRINATVEEYIEKFNELHDYVEDYFDNLNVQQEINNKLDAMVEAGTLQEIIADYLNSKAVFGFDTVASMKSSTNLIDGSYAHTLGYHTKNDGGEAFYKIRSITNDDTVDERFIIEMNDGADNLIAELIVTDKINPEMVGAYGDDTHDDSSAIQACLSSQYPIVMTKTYLINSTLNVGGHDEYSLDAEASVIRYTGANVALLIQNINGGEIKLGKIIALTGNCIEYASTLGIDDRVIYTDLSFKRLISDDKCIYIHTASGGYVSENTIRGGEMTRGNYGVYITTDPSAPEVGINAIHFINMGFEGTLTNYYINAISNYIRGLTFTNDRFVEYASTTKVMELHGNCQRFTMNTWSHLDETRLVIGNDATLRRLTLNCPVYVTGTTTIYADGIFFDGSNKIYIFKPPYNKLLTNNTGVTGSIKVYKIGNICTINFNNVVTTSASMDLVTTDHHVEYLPEQSMNAVLTTSNGSATARVWVRSNGSIAFATQSANIGEGFYGELTYTTLGSQADES